MGLEELLRKLIWTIRHQRRLLKQLESEVYSPEQLKRLEHLMKECKDLVDLEPIQFS